MAATDDAEPQDVGEQDYRHDEGYKYVLSDALNFLHFMKKYIAPTWMADISADDIEKVNKSYVTGEILAQPARRRRARANPLDKTHPI